MRSIYDFVPAPTARYPMNDNAATAVVVDSTGSHEGTYKDGGGDLNTDTGASAGKINGALDFDGVDENVEIADHADFSPILTPFSISVWAKMDDATDFVIASKYDTAGTKREWLFYTQAADLLVFLIYDEINDKTIVRAYTSALTSLQGSWIHVMGIYDGGILDTSLRLLLNGVRVDDLNAGSGGFVSCRNTAAKIKIGNADALYSNGLIDNVMIFDQELTARQAMKLADFRGKESFYGPRPNRIYHKKINNSIFGGIKGCTV